MAFSSFIKLSIEFSLQYKQYIKRRWLNFMNYKDFNVIVFTGDVNTGNKGFIKYRKQTSLRRFQSYVDTKYPLWKFMTLYDRKTNEKELIKNNGIQPASFQK
jgi:hypothetical protein